MHAAHAALDWARVPASLTGASPGSTHGRNNTPPCGKTKEAAVAANTASTTVGRAAARRGDRRVMRRAPVLPPAVLCKDACGGMWTSA